MASNFFEKLNTLKQQHEDARADGTVLEPMPGFFAAPGDPVPLVRKPSITEWEAQSQASLAASEEDKAFVFYICSQNLSPWSERGLAMMDDLKSGRLTIPDKDGDNGTAPAPARSGDSSDTSSQKSRVSGVRLEKPPTKISR